MNVLPIRSYAKESTKSKPSGIRFDLEKLEFIKLKEKLNTNQKVVDFLLNKYWWEYKIPKPTHKEVPPIEIEEEQKQELPAPSFSSHTSKVSLFDTYRDAKRACPDYESWQEIAEQIQNDTRLTEKQKSVLIKY